ncbi:hypothetical protein IT084_08375 [Desulfallas sp. Bu1-1]|uniref:sigma factor-like helix-turn-helix DNA-binding protein n=1 Tax=Desulfallas sp. Bu1-1 TaxID=2787620 RepID=UPI00189E3914|nr:sigma factor-like helix-turn-helix DNA-binding protein [Desulfallas sp. Bu1-1]MBF7082990.1 hypothetical protein [Desulfallas sp. Bu1-1]
MDFPLIQKIVHEELEAAYSRIIERLEDSGPDDNSCPGLPEDLPPLPNNPKYQKALDLYLEGASHSQVSRELGTSMNNVKRYYNWLVNHGYLNAPEEPLSEREQEVVKCLFEKGMSLVKTAQHLGISVPNVVQRRDSALRKGYKIPLDYRHQS